MSVLHPAWDEHDGDWHTDQAPALSPEQQAEQRADEDARACIKVNGFESKQLNIPGAHRESGEPSALAPGAMISVAVNPYRRKQTPRLDRFRACLKPAPEQPETRQDGRERRHVLRRFWNLTADLDELDDRLDGYLRVILEDLRAEVEHSRGSRPSIARLKSIVAWIIWLISQAEQARSPQANEAAPGDSRGHQQGT